MVWPTERPNGIALSPDGATLYYAETRSGRVYQRPVTGPGEVPAAGTDPAGMLVGLPGLQYLDSMAVDGAGNVCVGTLHNGGITVVAPDGDVPRSCPPVTRHDQPLLRRSRGPHRLRHLGHVGPAGHHDVGGAGAGAAVLRGSGSRGRRR